MNGNDTGDMQEQDAKIHLGEGVALDVPKSYDQSPFGPVGSTGTAMVEYTVAKENAGGCSLRVTSIEPENADEEMSEMDQDSEGRTSVDGSLMKAMAASKAKRGGMMASQPGEGELP